MSRERVREVNSQKEEEWTTVDRRRKAARFPSQASMNEGRGGSSVKKMFKIRDHFVSVFVDNLPAYMDNGALRGLFSDCGRVRDVFVPWKWRPSMNVRYGFVRFESFREAEEAIGLMDGRVLEGRKMVVRMVRQTGKPNQERRRTPLVYSEKIEVESVKGIDMRRDKRSYREVVYGTKASGDNMQTATRDQESGRYNVGVGRRKVIEGKKVVEDFDSNLTFIGRVKCCKNIDGTIEWFKEKPGLKVQSRCIVL